MCIVGWDRWADQGSEGTLGKLGREKRLAGRPQSNFASAFEIFQGNKREGRRERRSARMTNHPLFVRFLVWLTARDFL